jgi:hypothetical protein
MGPQLLEQAKQRLDKHQRMLDELLQLQKRKPEEVVAEETSDDSAADAQASSS